MIIIPSYMIANDMDSSKGNTREHQYTNKHGCYLKEYRHTGMWFRNSLPFGINHLVGDFLIGTDAINGTLSLRHQCVEFTALIVGKDVLPLPLGVLLGMLKHLQQLFGLVHRSGGVNVKRSWSSALRRCL